MLKLPIQSQIKPNIGQLFGSTQYAEWYKANGIYTAHNGTDISVLNDRTTYGTRLVCPLKDAYRSKVTFDHPMSTYGNGITIGGKYEGRDIQIVFWHLSEVVSKPSYKEGETVGFMGNSGICLPRPTAQAPWAGSHLHLAVYENGEYRDPADYFDFNTWYEGDDTDMGYDFAPLRYFLDLIQKGINALK